MVAPLLFAVVAGLPSLLGLAGIGVGVHTAAKSHAEHKRTNEANIRVGILILHATVDHC